MFFLCVCVCCFDRRKKKADDDDNKSVVGLHEEGKPGVVFHHNFDSEEILRDVAVSFVNVYV